PKHAAQFSYHTYEHTYEPLSTFLVVLKLYIWMKQTAVEVFGGGGYTDGTDIHPLMGVLRPCDERRSVGGYVPLFPASDFSLIESDEDTGWKTDVREPNEGTFPLSYYIYLPRLWTRKEKEIAVVYSCFIPYNHLELSYCELRSMVIADKGMIGSDPSATNYPGKIPQGPDLPSAAVVVKTPPNSSSSTNV
ncbi:hypothetical protein MKX03_009263, partial [Papaver bracteatum]